MGLELYAKVESLLGFQKERELLYRVFLEKLDRLGVKSVLDVGCGSGAFMELASKKGYEIEGVDLSVEMVKRANEKNLNCMVGTVADVKKRYEAAVAVFDVLNYIPPDEIGSFLKSVANSLEPGGYFLCDINTLFGFEEVAQGALWVDDKNEFVAVDAEFREGILKSDIIYFYKDVSGCYKKAKDSITQYYHDVNQLKVKELEIVDIDFVSLFSDEADKAVLTYKRV